MSWTVASWNVNSLNARLPQVVDWLRAAKPDVLLLQELKGVTESFPHEAFMELGYSAAVHGQKTYNGVAILARERIEDVRIGLDGNDPDPTQARYIEALIGGKRRVASVYVPNGSEPGDPKYDYKMEFYKVLTALVKDRLADEEAYFLGGDFNVAASPLDTHDPIGWQNRILFTEAERAAFARLCGAGLFDTYRLKQPQMREYSWWDYRDGSFPQNRGARIDYVLANAAALAGLADAHIDAAPRSNERPSDHTPVICSLSHG
ncbi:MAG: exodeoxyribonuclease III [Alphaproteobacteria bacterium]|nr:exodeoxyribonuclease III [Thalassospira sp.]MCE2964502.1 exodeoxyribonuclease III [Alphaproteobacteria bacterium]